MAFTKVTAAGIGTTQPLELTGVNLTGVVTATGLYVTGVSTFTGNVSIAGTLTYEDVTNIDAVGLITARSGIEFGTRPGLGASISDIGNAVFAGVVTATSFSGDGSALTGVASTDNIRTNTNATFLQNVNISGVTTVSAGSASAPSITATGDLDTGIFFPAADTIGFAEGGSEAARIDSSGRLLVGTTSVLRDREGSTNRNGSTNILQPVDQSGLVIVTNQTSSNDAVGGRVSVQRFVGANTAVLNDDELGSIVFGGSTGDGSTVCRNAAQIAVNVDGTPGSQDMPGRLVFSTTADGAAAPTERMRIDSQGRMGLGTTSPQADLHIGNGSGNGVEIGNSGTLQVIDRGNSRIEPLTVTAEHVAISIARNSSTTLHDERARFTYDGLTFNGDTAAANALDDYEEGTYTPTITQGFTSITYGTQFGRYTKIGRMVYVQFRITIASGNRTADTNNIRVSLPFAVSADGDNYAILEGYGTLFSYHKDAYFICFQGESYAALYRRGTNTQATLDGDDFGSTNNFDVIYGGWYYI